MTKTVILKVDGLKLSGELYLPAGQPPYPTICVCHGIPSGKLPDPADRGYPQLAETICREGFAVLTFNFRGARSSEGNFDILGWTRDLKTAIDYLWTLPEIDKSRLSLLGFSGGAAVSVYVAAQDKRVSFLAAAACLAEFTISNRSDTQQAFVNHFRKIGTIRDAGFPPSVEDWIKSFAVVKPVKYISAIAPRPLLLVHGSKDEVVDISHARRLYAEAREPKQLIIIEGAGHRLRREEIAVTEIIRWLKTNTSVV